MRKSPIFDAAVYLFLHIPNRAYVAEIVRFRISGVFGILIFVSNYDCFLELGDKVNPRPIVD